MARTNRKEEALRRLRAIGIDNLIDDGIKPRERPDPSRPKLRLKVFHRETPILALEDYDKNLILALDELVQMLNDDARVKRLLHTAVRTRHHSHLSHKNVREILFSDVSAVLKAHRARANQLSRERSAELAPQEQRPSGAGRRPDALDSAHATAAEELDVDDHGGYDVQGTENLFDEEDMMQDADEYGGYADVQDNGNVHNEEEMAQDSEEHGGYSDLEDTANVYDEEEVVQVGGQCDPGTLEESQGEYHDTVDAHNEPCTSDVNDSGNEDHVVTMDAQDKPGVTTVLTTFINVEEPEPAVKYTDIQAFMAREGVTWPDVFGFPEDNSNSDYRLDFVAISVPDEDDPAAEAAYKHTELLAQKLQHLSSHDSLAERMDWPIPQVPESHLEAAFNEAKDAARQAMHEAMRENGSREACEKSNECMIAYDRAEFEWHRNMTARLVQMEHKCAHSEHGFVLSPKWRELYESVLP
ncbi:uncharacterized protein J3D65DRAFT_607271 [Phyllosticta citribraziliensis]|uniref:Uncharacterized protein n=1 Tax=Phyllosticta citribraziliensis TaxID=989973 RepID=A0ABR1L6B0_9PEZI